MAYLLFTYPNCAKCEAMKKKLAEAGTPYAEYGLTQTPGKAKIREIINVIKRDDKGAIIHPPPAAHPQGAPRALPNPFEDDEDCPKSRP